MPKNKANLQSADSPVVVKYIYKDDYNPVYTNGAYGGVTSSGEIVANFYFERHPLPKMETLFANKQEFVPDDLTNSAVRIIQTGIILNCETAKQLADWLYENIEKAKALKAFTDKMEDSK